MVKMYGFILAIARGSTVVAGIPTIRRRLDDPEALGGGVAALCACQLVRSVGQWARPNAGHGLEQVSSSTAITAFSERLTSVGVRLGRQLESLRLWHQ